MEKSYRTKQRACILDYLKSNINKHITADEIIEHFKETEHPIGKATVYRYLDNLVKENVVRKYVSTEQGLAACYQFVESSDDCNCHYHMKCINCGALIHLECDEIKELSEHIYKEHKFKLDVFKTVLYGTCSKCIN